MGHPEAVALNHAVLERLARAMRPGQDEGAADRSRRQGANPSRAMVELGDAIQCRRGGGAVIRDDGRVTAGAVAPPPVAGGPS